MLLTEKDKKILLSLFKLEIRQPVEVLAYGSRVNGNAHDASDLDLVIKAKDNQPLDWDLLMNLNEKIKESNIPFLVELRDWHRLPESFHRQILNKQEILYQSD